MFKKLYTRPVVMKSDRWIKIEESEIPESIKDFIYFDGKTVDTSYGVKYNKQGRPVSYGGLPITHWMPLPSKPKE